MHRIAPVFEQPGGPGEGAERKKELLEEIGKLECFISAGALSRCPVRSRRAACAHLPPDPSPA